MKNNNNGRKFELVKDETCQGHYHRDLYRIRALRDFGKVKKGDLGGFVSCEHNLSHEGSCWVFDTARVKGFGTRVEDNARIGGNASVFGGTIFGNARIDGHANVGDDVRVGGNAHITGHADVGGWGVIIGNTKLCGNVLVDFNPLIESGTYSTGVIHSTPPKPRGTSSPPKRGPSR